MQQAAWTDGGWGRHSSIRTLAPATRPVTAPYSALPASASGSLAATWSQSSPSASAPDARTGYASSISCTYASTAAALKPNTTWTSYPNAPTP
jgi:hypothetical protein